MTTVELTVCIVIGVLPGISSAFTRKYVQGISSSAKEKSKKHSHQQFSRLQERSRSKPQSGVDGGAMELTQSSHHVVVTADDMDEHMGVNGSTDQIIDSSKGGITKITHISVDSQVL